MKMLLTLMIIMVSAVIVFSQDIARPDRNSSMLKTNTTTVNKAYHPEIIGFDKLLSGSFIVNGKLATTVEGNYQQTRDGLVLGTSKTVIEVDRHWDLVFKPSELESGTISVTYKAGNTSHLLASFVVNPYGVYIAGVYCNSKIATNKFWQEYQTIPHGEVGGYMALVVSQTGGVPIRGEIIIENTVSMTVVASVVNINAGITACLRSPDYWKTHSKPTGVIWVPGYFVPVPTNSNAVQLTLNRGGLDAEYVAMQLSLLTVVSGVLNQNTSVYGLTSPYTIGQLLENYRNGVDQALVGNIIQELNNPISPNNFACNFLR